MSVVIATYNRSNVLALALESLVGQTFRSWEAWVIGDACTDDTETVVRRVGDPRIRFHNLAVNCGEQSGPNNEGVRRARGRAIAFLNHDDLWFPDHLETLTAALEETRSDMVFSVVALMGSDGEAVLHPSWTGVFEPVGVLAPASGWLLRSELADRVGPWRSAREMTAVPSQDWLLRARAAGAALRQVPAVTVLAIPSANQPGSYARRDSDVQTELWRRMHEPGFRERLVTRAAVATAAELRRPRVPSPTRMARDLAWLLLRGWTPRAIMWLRYRRKGGPIDKLRRVRGLPPLR